jgi:hypothetical protein
MLGINQTPLLCVSVTTMMELKPNAGSDRAWVWNTLADLADESPKPELLAIRFLNAESEYWCILASFVYFLCSKCWCLDLIKSHRTIYGQIGRYSNGI